MVPEDAARGPTKSVLATGPEASIRPLSGPCAGVEARIMAPRKIRASSGPERPRANERPFVAYRDASACGDASTRDAPDAPTSRAALSVAHSGQMAKGPAVAGTRRMS